MVRAMFKTNELVLLGVSALAAFALMFWLFDWSLAGALVWTVAYTLLAVLIRYYKNKRSS